MGAGVHMKSDRIRKRGRHEENIVLILADKEAAK
jgi:hypothetical protein